MCNKAVDNYPSAIHLVPVRHKTQEMCDKAVHTRPVVFDSVLDQYKGQKICDKIVFKDLLY